MTGKASTAISRRLQRNFKFANVEVTVEQWSVLFHLWKTDGMSQQELCNATFRDKPSITRLVDNLEKQKLVKRNSSKDDRRKNSIVLTEAGKELEERCIAIGEQTLLEALEGVSPKHVDVAREVLQLVYDNLK